MIHIISTFTTQRNAKQDKLHFNSRFTFITLVLRTRPHAALSCNCILHTGYYFTYIFKTIRVCRAFIAIISSFSDY